MNDSEAPSAPAQLSVAAQVYNSITLTWIASTDNIGVSGYKIFRNGAEIGSTAATVYTDNGYVDGSHYSYFVRAYDASNNLSPESNTLTITQNDTQSPSAPTNLRLESKTDTTISIIWDTSTDNVGVTNYEIFSSDNYMTSTSEATYSSLTELQPLTTYNLTVRAKDAQGNVSETSNMLSVTTNAPPDLQAPSVPQNLTGTNISPSEIRLCWDSSLDNVMVVGYKVYRDGNEVGSTETNSYTDGGLLQEVEFTYTVKAFDSAGNFSLESNFVEVTIPDLVPPTAPADLTLESVTEEAITIIWTPSTDNIGVAGYKVFRDGSEIGSTDQITYMDCSFNQGATYIYTVKAFDQRDNLSLESNQLSVEVRDTQSPTAPSNLAVTTKTDTSICLIWTDSTDNVKVELYDVYQNGSVIASVYGTSYTVVDLAAGTEYEFFINAKDKAGNISTASQSLIAATLTSVPQNIVTTSTKSSITLSWDECIGADGYEIEVDGQIIDNGINRVYLHDQLLPDLQHTYRLRSKRLLDRSA